MLQNGWCDRRKQNNCRCVSLKRSGFFGLLTARGILSNALLVRGQKKRKGTIRGSLGGCSSAIFPKLLSVSAHWFLKLQLETGFTEGCPLKGKLILDLIAVIIFNFWAMVHSNLTSLLGASGAIG